MSDHGRPKLRIFLDQPLNEGGTAELPREQAHYLANVMRAKAGDQVLVFNGRDGEWLARLERVAKSGGTLVPMARTRAQAPEPDLWLLAAPIKKDRVDMVAEKAAELGASRLWPVFTQHTAMTRVNTERLAAHLVEAAEQCERLTVPELAEPAPLDKVLADWPEGRALLFLDESGAGRPALEVMSALADGPAAILVGPEGGFSAEERRWLAALPFVRPIAMGPRILRAETAAIAALVLWQATRGDWAKPPRS